MTLIKCVAAYMALAQLIERDWCYADAYALHLLRRSLQPHADFYAAQEKKLVDKHAVTDEQGNIIFNERGGFTFKSPDTVRDYMRMIEQLNATAVDIQNLPITVTQPNTIRPAAIDALDGFIIFGDGDI